MGLVISEVMLVVFLIAQVTDEAEEWKQDSSLQALISKTRAVREEVHICKRIWEEEKELVLL